MRGDCGGPVLDVEVEIAASSARCGETRSGRRAAGCSQRGRLGGAPEADAEPTDPGRPEKTVPSSCGGDARPRGRVPCRTVRTIITRILGRHLIKEIGVAQGTAIIIAKRGQYPEYLMQVFESTNQLFFLLEAVELLAVQVAAGGRSQDFTRAFIPSSLGIGIRSAIPNVTVSMNDEIGCEGRLVQLAYQGWIAAVDGAWEKYRTQPPYDPTGSLKHGQQADLFGDLHKIRNDVLKHRVKATRANTGKCKVLRWFQPGDDMRFSLTHVLDFLHHAGCYMRPVVAEDGSLIVQWDVCDREAQTKRIISNRVNIETIPKEKGGGFGLFISMMFADGVQWTVEVKRADNPDDLTDFARNVRNAPLDEYGAIIIPDGFGRMDVESTYRLARASLRDGQVPFDPGSPAIQFR